MVKRSDTLFFVVLLAVCLAFGCASRKNMRGGPGPDAPAGQDATPMRANPGYVQWLERQSFLYGAREMSHLVSGSERAFIAPSTGSNVKTLLDAASIWLNVRPSLVITSAHRPLFVELAEPRILDMLYSAGIRGIYMSPLSESGAVWLDPRKSKALAEDSATFTNAVNVGSDKDFDLFAAKAEARGMQIGSDLLPAATGIGPDFMLALRNVRDFPGLYIMSEAPKALWDLLPKVDEEEAGASLGDGELEALRLGQGAHIPAMIRDRMAFAERGGWAVSGEVVGVDGVRRRWFYRYAQSPKRPLLNWDDPSGSARRVLSASIIRQTGTMRMALAGLRLEPLFGLDLAPGEAKLDKVLAPREAKLDKVFVPREAKNYSLEPGPSATRDMSREIRRYGGWSLFKDRMPAASTAALHGAGVDFVLDSFTFPAAEYALLCEDAGPLRAALQNALAMGVDQSRLMRTMPAEDGVDFSPLLQGPGGSAVSAGLAQALQKNSAWSVPFKSGRLMATAATLAAISAGISPEKAVMPGEAGEILKRHLLLLGFRAALPGPLLVNGQDLFGVLNTPQGSAGAFSLGASGSMTRQGVQRAPEAYGQDKKAAQSFAEALGRFAQIRAQTGIALGRVADVPKTAKAGSVAVWSQLPGGDYLLVVANFSSSVIQEHINFPVRSQSGRLVDLTMSGKSIALDSDSAVNLKLEPWECRILLCVSGGVR